MVFGDISARFKKKKEETAPAPVERNHAEVHALRSKIVGVLIRDARMSKGMSTAEVASALRINEQELLHWEFGNESPSLPQLELLAYTLGVPVSHFWSNKTMGAEHEERSVPDEQYKELRDRVIGAKLMLARQEAKMSREELAAAAGLTTDVIANYEFGQLPIPVAELTSLSSAVKKQLQFFLEDTNRVGGWLALQEEYRRFSELPDELREFVMQPVNQPFIEVAMRLSRINVKELRVLAEDLLNITL